MREGQVGLDRVAVQDEEAVLGDRLADDGKVEVPFVEDGLRLGLLLGAQHHEHAFLALGQHHLVGRHVRFALGDAVEVEANAQAPLVAHLDGGTGEARGAHVLDRDHGARGHEFEAGLHQAFLGERVANLHGGAFLLDRIVKFGAGHCRAADAVAASLGTKVDDGHADAGGRRVEDGVRVGEAGGEGVDEAVAVVAAVEADLARDVGDAEGVAVAADALRRRPRQAGGSWGARVAEGERVHRGDGAGAHREDVAQDAADAGGRALVGFDVGGVVVAFHLEHQRLTVADVDDACVFAGAADDLRAGGVERAEPFLGRLVGTVFVPHRREDAEFGEGGLSPDDLEDAGVFVGLEPWEAIRSGVIWGSCMGGLRQMGAS